MLHDQVLVDRVEHLGVHWRHHVDREIIGTNDAGLLRSEPLGGVKPSPGAPS